jgi:hypothetical protein
MGREAGHGRSDRFEYMGGKEGWKLFFILIKSSCDLSYVCWLKIADVVGIISVPVIRV